jgi:hypothetical protein
VSKTRLGLLSLVAVLSTFAVLASSASAAIKFEWKVKEKLLAAGETRGFTTTSDGHVFDFHSSVAGAGILLLSSEVSVESGAEIIGGKPGTNKETVLFKGVTVANPLKCAVESEGLPPGTVQTFALKTEIVESEGTHEPVILFSPESGSNFVNLLLLNKGTEECVLKNVLASVTGNLLATPLPALTETLNGDLDFESPNSNFVLSNGTLEKAGLSFEGNTAFLTGLTLVILTTDEKYGAF